MLASCTNNQPQALAPFSSDGCSAFPDGTLEHKTLWLACCHEHDIAYWLGGTHQQRLAADQALESCVDQVGEETIAKLMLAGVRVGGSPYWPTSYRWGYGWPYLRGYQENTESEVSYAKKLLAEYEQKSRGVSPMKPQSKERTDQ